MPHIKTDRKVRTYKATGKAYEVARKIAQPTLSNFIEDVVIALSEGRKITIAKKANKVTPVPTSELAKNLSIISANSIQKIYDRKVTKA